LGNFLCDTLAHVEMPSQIRSGYPLVLTLESVGRNSLPT
jgi:hypothetical protein